MVHIGQSVIFIHITKIAIVLYIFAILTTVAGFLLLCFIKRHIAIDLLIGILYSKLSIKYTSVNIALNSELGHNWLYYTIKSLIVLLSLLLYCFVSRQYKQRLRDEPSTINERVIIEKYWERTLNRKEDIKEQEYSEIC